MKITVSARGKTLESEMDPRFGRSAGFVLFDTETDQTAYLDNSTQMGLAQGIGIKTAQMIADAGTNVLITGQMGPKAAQVLSRSGIKIYMCTTGTVQGAIQALERNELNLLGSSMLQAGPGKMRGRDMGGGGRGVAQGGRGRGGF
jgi:predicted Fe-Mo cluster-binding NifX family protein